MMQLRFSPTSPFARKVLVVAQELGLADRIEKIVINPMEADSGIWDFNPLGKIPALTLEDGTTLIDSPVACLHLCFSAGDAGAAMMGKDDGARLRIANLEALGDGLGDAAVARRFETVRPDGEKSPPALARYARKMGAALDSLEQNVAAGGLAGVDLGSIAVACALGYLDFRYGDEPWRDGRPALAAWAEAFHARPSLLATAPPT